MPQHSRPVADFAAATNFIAASASFPGPIAPNVSGLYETVDEAVVSDADGIGTTLYGPGTAWFTMGALTAPTSLRAYVRCGGNNVSNIYADLFLYEPDGTTLIDNQTITGYSAGSLATQFADFDISGGISDPSALVLKIVQDGFFSGVGAYIYTTQVYLYDDESSGGSGGEAPDIGCRWFRDGGSSCRPKIHAQTDRGAVKDLRNPAVTPAFPFSQPKGGGFIYPGEE